MATSLPAGVISYWQPSVAPVNTSQTATQIVTGLSPYLTANGIVETQMLSVGSFGDTIFQGAIAGNTLIVVATSVNGAPLVVGSQINPPPPASPCLISSILNNTTGAYYTYVVNGSPQNVPSTAFQVTGSIGASGAPNTTLTVTAVTTGALFVNAWITGPTIPPGTYVVSQSSGTPGGIGVYVVSRSLYVPSTISITGPPAVSSPWPIFYDAGITIVSASCSPVEGGSVIIQFNSSPSFPLGGTPPRVSFRVTSLDGVTYPSLPITAPPPGENYSASAYWYPTDDTTVIGSMSRYFVGTNYFIWNMSAVITDDTYTHAMALVLTPRNTNKTITQDYPASTLAPGGPTGNLRYWGIGPFPADGLTVDTGVYQRMTGLLTDGGLPSAILPWEAIHFASNVDNTAQPLGTVSAPVFTHNSDNTLTLSGYYYKANPTTNLADDGIRGIRFTFLAPTGAGQNAPAPGTTFPVPPIIPSPPSDLVYYDTYASFTNAWTTSTQADNTNITIPRLPYNGKWIVVASAGTAPTASSATDFNTWLSVAKWSPSVSFTLDYSAWAPLTAPKDVPANPVVTLVDGGSVSLTVDYAACFASTTANSPVAWGAQNLGIQYGVSPSGPWTTVFTTPIFSTQPAYRKLDVTSYVGTTTLTLATETFYYIRSYARNSYGSTGQFGAALFGDVIEVKTGPSAPLVMPSGQTVTWSGASTNTLALVTPPATGGLGTKTYTLAYSFLGSPSPPLLFDNTISNLFVNPGTGTVNYTIASSTYTGVLLTPDGGVPQGSPWNFFYKWVAEDEEPVLVSTVTLSLAQTVQKAVPLLDVSSAYVFSGFTSDGVYVTSNQICLPPGPPVPQVGAFGNTYAATLSWWPDSANNLHLQTWPFTSAQTPVTQSGFGTPDFASPDGFPDTGIIYTQSIATPGTPFTDVFEAAWQQTNNGQTPLYAITAIYDVSAGTPGTPAYTTAKTLTNVAENNIYLPRMLNVLNARPVPTVTLDPTSPSTATFAWICGSLPPRVPNVVNYRVEVTTDPNAIGSIFAASTAVSDSTHAVTFNQMTGLAPNTTYYPYIRMVYNNATTVIRQTRSASFTTYSTTFPITLFTPTAQQNGFSAAIPLVQPGGTNPIPTGPAGYNYTLEVSGVSGIPVTTLTYDGSTLVFPLNAGLLLSQSTYTVIVKLYYGTTLLRTSTGLSVTTTAYVAPPTMPLVAGVVGAPEGIYCANDLAGSGNPVPPGGVGTYPQYQFAVFASDGTTFVVNIPASNPTAPLGTLISGSLTHYLQQNKNYKVSLNLVAGPVNLFSPQASFSTSGGTSQLITAPPVTTAQSGSLPAVTLTATFPYGGYGGSSSPNSQPSIDGYYPYTITCTDPLGASVTPATSGIVGAWSTGNVFATFVATMAGTYHIVYTIAQPSTLDLPAQSLNVPVVVAAEAL